MPAFKVIATDVLTGASKKIEAKSVGGIIEFNEEAGLSDLLEDLKFHLYDKMTDGLVIKEGSVIKVNYVLDDDIYTFS